MTASSIDRPLHMEPSRAMPVGDEILTVDVVLAPSASRLVAIGEVDASTAAILREGLDAVLGAAMREFVVDLRAVTFLDSTGLRALADAHRRAAEQGSEMHLLAASRAVIRPLQITGLWELLGAEQTAAEATPRS